MRTVLKWSMERRGCALDSSMTVVSGCPFRSLVVLVLLVHAGGVAQDQVAENSSRNLPVRSSRALPDTVLPVHLMLFPAERPHHPWYEPVTNLPDDWSTAGGLAVREQSLPTLLSVGAATGVLLLTDHATFHASRTFYRNHRFVQKTSDVLVRFGEGTTHIGIAAGFAVYGWLGKDERAVRTASEITEALLATGITVQLLKRMTGRQSPQMALGGTGHWRPFPSLAGYQRSQPSYYSFPSGHIATAMATLTVIAENYPEQHWIRPVGYGVLAGLGISLVNIRYHWFSDLPLGMLLGYTFGRIAAHHDPGGNGGSDTQGRVLVEPSWNQSGAAVSVAWVY
jgi:membrane-associated phospholipid phosphatase